MAPFFRKPQKPVDGHRQDDRLANIDVEALVPKSAREPEGMRFTPLALPDELDDGDEDLQFLSSIVSSIDEKTAAPRRADPKPAALLAVETITLPEQRDDLAAFRNVGKDDDRVPFKHLMKVDDVDIGDLLDDLGTVAAAMRRRAA